MDEALFAKVLELLDDLVECWSFVRVVVPTGLNQADQCWWDFVGQECGAGSFQNGGVQECFVHGAVDLVSIHVSACEKLEEHHRKGEDIRLLCVWLPPKYFWRNVG